MDELIKKTIDFVKYELRDTEAGHDWQHSYRVWQMALKIAEREKADKLIVQLAALVHDIGEPKFHNGDETIGPARIRSFFHRQNLGDQLIGQIISIITGISFKNSFSGIMDKSPEFKVVQDADRLDAMGAVGIARAFHYGGYCNHRFYDPDETFSFSATKAEYTSGRGTTISHFYDKLLLLKDLMNTETGRKIAGRRHRVMERFLKDFYSEVNFDDAG